MSALEIANLSLAIGGAPILNGVSFKAAPGEITALVGESGSGKSLTLLSAMQLLPHGARLSGSVKLAGEELVGAGEARLNMLRGAAMGMVFQEPMSALNPVRTIGAQIAETVLLHKPLSRAEALGKARAALDRVGLREIGHERYPHELSGGQRQRVAIAIATVLAPALLLADEPTTALDVITQAGVLSLLRDLANAGAAVVLVTHDLSIVAHYADRVAIMRGGDIVDEAAGAGALRQLTHPYAKALLAAAAPRAPATSAPEPGKVLLGVEHAVVAHKRAGGGEVRALDGVSMRVHGGESVGVVGESGSGKSTLARVALGLQRLTSGAVRFDDKDWGAARGGDLRAMRRRAQIVFQDPYGSFNPRRRVGWLVGEPLHLAEPALSEDARRGRVAKALEDVGLSPGDAARYPHQFSGGQRQRIAIARALVTEPALLVLDEAVSALDVSIRAQILDLLADLRTRLGLSYLFITHDLAVVRSIADRVIVLQAGKIVEEGPARTIFDAPAHPYTAALAAASPRLDLGDTQ